MSNPSRQDLEDFWRERVYSARQKYNRAQSEVHELMEQQKTWPLPAPDGSANVRVALRAETAARDEYMRILKIFNNLIVYGKRPDDI